MSLHTPLCDLLNIKYPIIQAGMGWDKEGLTTPPALVAAVSNAGGLGCIGGSSIRPEVIRERIRAVRQLTDKPFGVDITLPKMEDVRIPDPDEVKKEIEEKFPKHAKFKGHIPCPGCTGGAFVPLKIGAGGFVTRLKIAAGGAQLAISDSGGRSPWYRSSSSRRPFNTSCKAGAMYIRPTILPRTR